MAKVKLVGGRRVAVTDTRTPAQKVKAVEKAHKAPAVRVKDTTKGLSLRQLMKATPPYLHSNAEEVTIRSLKPATTKGGMPAIRAKALSVGGKTRTVYDLHVIGKEPDLAVSSQKHVLVSCSCDFFLYSCEYALTHWGSAVIKYSNGEPATTTNPGNQPILCKHLVKLVDTILLHKM